jgi:hypothetical protein
LKTVRDARLFFVESTTLICDITFDRQVAESSWKAGTGPSDRAT